MLLDLDDSQLVLVDYQARLMPAISDAQAVLANAHRLARMAQLLKVPCWGTEQNPERLGPNPQDIRALCRRTLAKMSFGACDDGLVDWLRAACPGICKKPSHPHPLATPLCWRGVRPMSACFRPPWL
jgi:hypothetical protein